MTGQPAISARDVSITLGGERILHGVSRDFAKGMVHGIVGNNGSGKTVFFKCICGFLIPDEGEVIVALKAPSSIVPSRIAYKKDRLPCVSQPLSRSNNSTFAVNVFEIIGQTAHPS